MASRSHRPNLSRRNGHIQSEHEEDDGADYDDDSDDEGDGDPDGEEDGSD